MEHIFSPTKVKEPLKKSNFIESELKFLFNPTSALLIRKKILKIKNISYEGRFYEKTTMLDNYQQTMNKEDARLRVREIKNQQNSRDTRIEFSYKRRLQANGGIKKEEEIETSFVADADSFLKILNKMGYEVTTSYERYREIYILKESKITLDEFPFGYILEIEGEEKEIKKICRLLNLKISDSYALSCDDVYVDLCKREKIQPKDHILFDDPEMPKLK
ncbi:MAG: CYTH domain-containing protein [Candidatus Pacebacteria bacterium]|nr:CYTH domain-containing protein [Candidatus Paceibacterota bacterium]